MCRRQNTPSSRGRLSSGIQSGQLPAKTIRFVRDHLHEWRDDPERPDESQSEPVLNVQLCKFLNVKARTELPMVHFHHEERQSGQRRVDMSASPTESMRFAGTSYSIYTPFVVFEGKRLPAPEKNREREYLYGPDDKSPGGIQRFKRSLHGAGMRTAAMIGYLQDGDAEHWHQEVNRWIDELVAAGSHADELWSQGDRLEPLKYQKRRTATCRSHHERSGERSALVLHHLWVEF